MPDFIVRFFIRFSLSDLFICTIFLFRFSVGFICLIFSPISCSIFLSDLFVSIYMSDFLSDFMSDFLPDIFVRHVLVRFFSDFLIPFHVRFLPDFCPIFYVRFSLSDFFVRNFCSTCSCPIFFDRFFYPIFVRFILSDVFMTGFLSYFLCPIFARFDVSSFCPIFCPLFWPICCHMFCVISLQKRWNMSRHVMPPLSCTINVLVFLLL